MQTLRSVCAAVGVAGVFVEEHDISKKGSRPPTRRVLSRMKGTSFSVRAGGEILSCCALGLDSPRVDGA